MWLMARKSSKGLRAFDVPFWVALAALEAAQQLHLCFREHASFGRRLLLEPEQAVVSKGQPVPHPHAPDGRRRNRQADQLGLIRQPRS
jgi:hypothetical protein